MMLHPSLRLIHPLFQFAWPALTLLGDGIRFFVLCLRSPAVKRRWRDGGSDIIAEHTMLPA
jgi:hypothetical protein